MRFHIPTVPTLEACCPETTQVTTLPADLGVLEQPRMSQGLRRLEDPQVYTHTCS